MRVVVTGASGFLGRAAVVRLRNEGHEVIAVHRRPTGDDGVRVNDYSKSPSGDVLIHLAEVGDRNKVAQLGTSFVTDVQQRLRALLDGRFKQVIYASSSLVYAPSDAPLRVGSPVDTSEFYAGGKLACEAITLAAGGIVLQFSNLYGPGQTGETVVNTILSQVPGEGPIFIRDATPIRDFLSVRDAAAALAMAVNRSGPDIFNVGTGVATSIGDLAQLILELNGTPRRDVISTHPSASLKQFVLDIAETTEKTEWAPHVKLRQGIAELIKPINLPARKVARANSFDADRALAAIEAVVGDAKRPVVLHEPRFAGNEWKYVKETLDTGWVSSAGKYVDEFERRIADYCGVPYAVATMNGTAALHICLILAGVQAGDEVIVPALTFIATANAVSYCGAIPHFCDSDPKSLGLDPEKLDRALSTVAEVTAAGCRNKTTGRRISAVLPMHTFGHPVDMDRMTEVAARWRIPLIEDIAEALGSQYKGRHVGHHGILSALSFNGNKVVTTGGGGAILARDEKLARAAKHLTTTAKLPHKWAFLHDQIGYNYRLPNINAALGCAQLEQLDWAVGAKRALAARYAEAFRQVPGATIFVDASYARSNYWLVAMMLDEPDMAQRDDFLEACHARGLRCRPVWTAMHRLPMYINCPRMDVTEAEKLEARIVNLPSSAIL